MTQTALEETLQKSIQFYEKVRLSASARLSFAPVGANGLRDGSGAISSHSLSEMWDVCFLRMKHVLTSLVDHSELPDQVHELSLQESMESKLAATIFTAYSAWMIADLSELLANGGLTTVGSMIDNMMQHVAPAGMSRNTLPKRRPNVESLRSISIPDRPNGDREVPAKRRQASKKKKSKPSGKKSASTKRSRTKTAKARTRKSRK